MRSYNTFTILLVFAFLSLGFIGIVNHEMWLDELQAWLIARDSSSVVDLFKNLRYEGHPGLWHIGLYLISRWTHNPFSMQVFHLIIATSSIYIFAKFSPFTKSQKVVFSFGYFPFYEYSIISRDYALGILLVFCFCALFSTRTKSYLLLSSILFLLANTNVYGLIIAITLGLTLIFDYILCGMRTLVHSSKWDLIISFFIFSLGIVSSLIQIIPPPDASFAANWTTSFQTEQLKIVLAAIAKSYIPIPKFFKYQFWNTSIFSFKQIGTDLGAIFSLGLLVFSLILFARKPAVFFLYVTGNLGMLLFMYFKYLGTMRHWGHLFVLFITCLWLTSYYTNTEQSIYSDNKNLFSTFYKKITQNGLVYRHKNKIIMAILYTNLAAGIFAFTMDLYNPFSATKAVTNFVKDQKMENILIVGDVDYINFIGPPLSTYLDRKVYYLGSHKSRFGSFIVWDKNRASATKQEVYMFFNELNKPATVKEPDRLLVLNHKLENCSSEKTGQSINKTQLKFEDYCFEFKDLKFAEVAKFANSIIPDENPGFYLYFIQHKQ